MPSHVTIPEDHLRAFCHRWRIRELSIFGSALRDDFRADSDIDVMVEFEPGVRWRYYEMAEMRDQLQALVGRPVDLVEKRLVEAGPNPIRRRHILDHRETMYVA